MGFGLRPFAVGPASLSTTEAMEPNQYAGDNRRGPLQFYDSGFPNIHFAAEPGLPADVSAVSLIWLNKCQVGGKIWFRFFHG